MRRWTDGKSWSASRVSGSFLTYREMEGKRGGNGFAPPVQAVKRTSGKTSDGSKGDSDEDGPDGYRYKPDGLMKQSFSITTQNGQHLHLISYYARSHPTAPGLQQPTLDPSLRHIRPPKNMYPESTVNETSSVPAVTRGPMPGSPYTPAPHQMGMGSPYNRPGAAHPQGYGPAPGSWPPTPNGTPPFPYAFYPPQPPQQPNHSPLQYAQAAYPPQQYPQHPPGPTAFDRPPPPISNPALPPPPPQIPPMTNGHPPHIMQHPPQYIHNPSPRAIQATQLGQQHHHHHHHHHQQQQQQQHPHVNGHQIDPRLTAPSIQTSEGHQLPALTGSTGPGMNGDKPPSPHPSETRNRSSDSLAVPETNCGVANNAPSPARTIPSVGSLLNTNPPNDIGMDSRNEQSVSRAGSRSPNSGAPRTAQDIPGDRISIRGADQKALRKLDSMMMLR